MSTGGYKVQATLIELPRMLTVLNILIVLKLLREVNILACSADGDRYVYVESSAIH